MTSLEYYIEQIEQFISMLTDDIKSGEGATVTQTKLTVYQEVLEHLEEIEQEPCEDAVSRQAVEETIKAEMPERGMWEIEGDKEKETVCEVCVDLIQKLSQLPSVNPQPKTGEWIYKPMEGTFCSECDEPSVWKFNYCPNCGAKMVEPQKK